MHLPPCYTRMTRSHDFDGSRVFDGIDLYGEEKTGNHTKNLLWLKLYLKGHVDCPVI